MKAYFISFLVVLIVIFGLLNLWQRNKVINSKTEIKVHLIENEKLVINNANLDQQVELNLTLIDSLNSDIKSRAVVEVKLKAELKAERLREVIEIEEVSGIPDDQSYEFILKHFKTNSALIYPFAGSQVKDIHILIITNKSLNTQNNILSVIVTSKDSTISSLNKSNKALIDNSTKNNQKIENLQEMYDNQVEVSESYKKSLRSQRFWNIVLKVGVVILGVVAII